jgi:hypothetical protein
LKVCLKILFPSLNYSAKAGNQLGLYPKKITPSMGDQKGLPEDISRHIGALPTYNPSTKKVTRSPSLQPHHG